jgi:hypothetical protein
MLTRRHAEEILKLPSLVDPDHKDLVVAWNTVHAPEEVYFSTMLSLLGYLRDDPKTIHTTQRNSEENPFLKVSGDEVWRRRVCYAEWKRRSDANPMEFTSLSVSLCDHFRRKGSLFARKFGSNSVSVSHWRDVLRASLPLALLKNEWNPSVPPPAPALSPAAAPPGQDDLQSSDEKKISSVKEETNSLPPSPAAPPAQKQEEAKGDSPLHLRTDESHASSAGPQQGEQEQEDGPPAKKMKSAL